MDDAWIPIGDPRGPFADGLGEAQVESPVIHADDQIGSKFDAAIQQLMEQAPERPVAAEDLPETDDGMPGEILDQVDTGSMEGGAATAGERDSGTELQDVPDHLGSELVTARIARNDEDPWTGHGESLGVRRGVFHHNSPGATGGMIRCGG